MNLLRSAPWPALICALGILFLSHPAARADVALATEVLRLINNFMATLPASIARPRLVEAEVPTFGCPQDGQVGPQEAPTLPTTMRVVVPDGFASSLAFYSASEGFSVLAPRGWDCFGTYGSAGSALYVTPRRLGDPILERPEKVVGGPVVIRKFFFGGTSGRFPVARMSARIFPRARAFVESVRGEDVDDPKQYVFAPWPNDTVKYLSDLAVSYMTPPRSVGLGTDLGVTAGQLSIYGLAFLHDLDTEPYLDGLALRLDEREQRLYAAIIVAQIAATAARAQQQPRPLSRQAQPYELTSQGNIAASVNEAYKAAIEACPRGTGNVPQDSRFVACLRQQIQRESAALETAYKGTLSYLASSPDKIARLRRAERAWLQFQSENCAFARDAAPAEHAQEFLYDCELRSTIERRIELRSLVGD